VKPTIKSALETLCRGKGKKTEIQLVVAYFIQSTRDILVHKTGLVNEWRDTEAEVVDLALDFIGPLFARDEKGVFYELEMYFAPRLSASDEEFEQAIRKLLLSVVRQESIRIFSLRDPVGRVFYRSLHYLLEKHADWQKQNHPLFGPRIFISPEASLVDHEDIQKALHQAKAGLLTRDMEQVLEEFVERKNKSVAVVDLLACVRQVNWGLPDLADPLLTYEEPDLALSLEEMVADTIRQVKKNILQQYCQKGKLTPEECDYFTCALTSIMRDFTDGGISQTYFEYLCKSFGGHLTLQEYQQFYRNKFEYVIKNAKKIFSADVKIVFRV
jgi:hypothetical protein